MGILEGIIYTLWRGLAIGVIISAPMGPVGILCVQRTLDKGRRTGLYTGVGAALSDLLYCLLTGFGLSFIEEFLERNSNVIQIIGSVVLIGFGIYLFRSNPSRKLKKRSDQKIPAGKNILNGFLFTFSNPLIIFLIIGLFARFNFLALEIKWYQYIIGYISIIAGAMLWWYVVTFFVDKVRAHFNLRSMWLINKIIGGIIMIFAVVGIITAVSGLANAAERTVYMNPIRGYKEFQHATDSTLIIGNTTSAPVTDMIAVGGYDSMRWRMRVTNSHARHNTPYLYHDSDGKAIKVKYPGWGIVLKDGADETTISFTTIDERTDETYSSPRVEVTVKSGGKETAHKTLSSGFDLYDGPNAFQFSVDDVSWQLRGGNREYKEIVAGDFSSKLDSIGFIVMPGGEIKVEDISISLTGTEDIKFSDNAFSDFDLTDEMEGEWGVFDMNIDEKMLKTGGDYRLAIKKSKDRAGYDIIYLSGAVTNVDKWKPGMIKGRILPLPFDSVYDIEWVGASGKTLKGIKAQKEGDILTLQFPSHASSLRLRKIPAPKN